MMVLSSEQGQWWFKQGKKTLHIVESKASTFTAIKTQNPSQKELYCCGGRRACHIYGALMRLLTAQAGEIKERWRCRTHWAVKGQAELNRCRADCYSRYWLFTVQKTKRMQKVIFVCPFILLNPYFRLKCVNKNAIA